MTSHHLFAPPTHLLSSLSGLLLLTAAAFPISCTSDDSNGKEQGAAGSGMAGAGGVGSGGVGAGGSEALEQIPETQGMIALTINDSFHTPYIIGTILFAPNNDGTTWSLKVRRAECEHTLRRWAPDTDAQSAHAGAIMLSSNLFSNSYSPAMDGRYDPISIPLDRPVDEIGQITVAAQGNSVPSFSTSISMFNQNVNVTRPVVTYDADGLGHIAKLKNIPLALEWEPFDGNLSITIESSVDSDTQSVRCLFDGKRGRGDLPEDFLGAVLSFGGQIEGWYYPLNSKTIRVGEYEILVSASTKVPPPNFGPGNSANGFFFTVDVE